jgi:hypothetical protein
VNAKHIEHPLEFLTEHYFGDPLNFVRDCFPWGQGLLADADGPEEWQVEVLIRLGQGSASPEEALQIAVASGHGVGKSALMAWIVLWFLSTRPHPQVVVTANTQNQLATKTWRELAKWSGLFEFGGLFQWTATRFCLRERPETWFAAAVPWSEHNTEAFAGTHEKHVLLLFDEASKIADPVWEVAEGAMTTPGAMWVVFGNPTRNTGRFRECFGRLRHRWFTLQVDSRTCKVTDKSRIDQWIEDYGEDSDFVRVRVRGVFPRAGETQFIPVDLAEAASTRQVLDKDLERAPRVIGVDVARYGGDRSVVLKRRGLRVEEIKRFRGVDNMTLAGITAREIVEFKPDAVFVDAGYGSGVIDRLRQLGFPVCEINFGGRAIKAKRYMNKRAEMWGEMREWLKAGGAIPDDRELRDDLTGPEYGFDAQDRIQLEKKDDMKKRGLASPDCGDALALTFAMPVQRAGDEDHGPDRNQDRQYDMLNY